MPNTQRVAIYARVSTKDKGQDTENQLHELREFCQRSGWEVTAEYVDEASGKSSDRTQFKAMFQAASQRKFDTLVTWTLDRLSREGVAQTFEHIKRLRSYGVQYISYKEEHFRTTGPAGELMLAVAAWIAEQERLRLSERTKAGLRRAKRAGKVLGRRKVVVNREKVHQMSEEGMTTREIGEEFGISAASVCRILKTSSLQEVDVDWQLRYGSDETHVR